MLEFSRNSVEVFGYSVRYYGILIALGVLLGSLLAMKREKRLGLPGDTVIDLVLVCVPAAIICARLYYVIFEWEQFRGNLLSIFNLRGGGLAIYGGLIGAFGAGAAYCRIKKLNFLKLADMAAPSIALGQAVGRWGNFFNQEAYGVAITAPALQFFPAGVFIQADQTWHCATFFYESAWCLALCVFLLAAHRRSFFRRTGDTIMWYAMLYGLERAIVEGLRTDSLYLGPLRVSQALSILLIFASALAVYLRPGGLRAVRRAALLMAAVAVALSLANLIYPALIMAVLAVALVCAAYPKTEKSPA